MGSPPSPPSPRREGAAQQPAADAPAEQERYFADAHKWAGFHRKLADEKGLDAWFRVIDRIAALFPDWDVEVAAQGGRTYFSGIFRALNDSTFLHCDFSPYDSLTEDWIINSVECQAVFNLFLAPVKDGNTVRLLAPPPPLDRSPAALDPAKQAALDPRTSCP